MGTAREEKKDNQKREIQKTEDQVREKVRQSRSIVFPMICGSGGSRSRFPTVAGAEPSGQILWRKANFEAKMH